jgi:hypothetical protein
VAGGTGRSPHGVVPQLAFGGALDVLDVLEEL